MKPNYQGWFSGVRHIASPNHDARSHGSEISLLVIHNISLPPDAFGGSSICEFFTNQLDCSAHPYFERLRELKVSSHFLIRRTGEIVQFVACQRRAWHAGVSEWQGRSRCNDFSIGIELEGSDFVAFDSSQYKALARLTRQLKRHYPIRQIVGHSDIAPGRKTDPGPFFDWAHYLNLVE